MSKKISNRKISKINILNCQLNNKLINKQQKIMLIFAKLFYLYSLLHLAIFSDVDCSDKYCQQCGYDKSQDQNELWTTDDYQTCLTCQYPWLNNRSICVINNCQWSCTQCDLTGNYCIGCNFQYYNLSVYGCQLNSKMIGIVTIFSILLFIVLIWVSCCCCRCCCYYNQCCLQRYRQKKSQEMARGMSRQNISNLNIAVNQRTNPKQNNLQKKKDERRIIDSENECSICLEDNCEVISRCGHAFHAPCLYIWVTKKNLCPLCNVKLINIVNIINCLECRTQTKQYNILQLNEESIKQIGHKLCNRCQFKPNDTQQGLNQNKFHQLNDLAS